MSRARPFAREHVTQRRSAVGLYPVAVIPDQPVQAFPVSCSAADQLTIDKLVKAAGIAAAAQREFAYKMKTAIAAYRVRLLAHQQERPAAIVATIKPVLEAAQTLQQRYTLERQVLLLRHLLALPDSLRFDLRTGAIERVLRMQTTSAKRFRRLTVSVRGLIEPGKAQQSRLQDKIAAGAPTGSAAIGAAFRELVLMTLDEYRPDTPDAQRRQWAGDVWEQVGDAALEPKKHAKRFKAGFVSREDARRRWRYTRHMLIC
jgi:hypothetical protein